MRTNTSLWAITFLFLFPALVFGKSPGSGSKKSLDFDGEVVEGMNKQPLDSLSQISEQEGARKKKHLYQVRTKYTKENKDLIREIAETY